MLAASPPRAMGAYATPSVAAEDLVRWAVRRDHDRVLGPSMGDGAVLAALPAEARRRGINVLPWGVELASDPFERARARHADKLASAVHADFLEVEPFPVDAVVGNPPFVRLRHLADGRS